MKLSGVPDPTPLTYTPTGFLLGDSAATVLTGALTRAPGENVNTSPGYAITQGNLAASGNYTISFTGNYLTITPATLTVKANPQTKVYGQPDPTPRSDTACASLPGYSPAPPSPRYITPADAHNGSTHPATPPYQTTLSP